MKPESFFTGNLFPAIVLALLTSCNQQPVVKFESPQPSGQKDLSEFPTRFVGSYRNDDALMIVAPATVLYRNEADLVEHRDSLNIYFDFAGDTVIEKSSGEKFGAVIKGDSVYWRYTTGFDTVFAIDKGGKLRKLKGYYFLNHPIDSGMWEVKKLSFPGNKLVVGIIADSTDIAKLQEITETVADSLKTFNPSRKQFRKYVRHDGFGYETVFYRVKD